LSTKTTNFEFIKPELTDAANITAQNPNWDKLDTWMNDHNIESIDVSIDWLTDGAFDECYAVGKTKRYWVNVMRASGEVASGGKLTSMTFTDENIGFTIVNQWFTVNGVTWYRSANISMQNWGDWKQLNVIDTELSETSENAVQNKVVTSAINEVKDDITSITGNTTTVKCHVGDTIPTGKTVTIKSISLEGDEYTVRGDGAVGVTISKGDRTDFPSIEAEIQLNFQGGTVTELHNYVDSVYISEYREDAYVVFEVVVEGSIAELEDKLKETDDRLLNLNNNVFGGTMTVKCHVGDTVPTGSSVIFAYVHTPNGGDRATTDGSTVINAGDYTSIPTGTVMNTGEGCHYNGIDLTGGTISLIADYAMSENHTEYKEDVYAVFEVTADGLISYGTEELTEGTSPLATGSLYIVYE
jgi:hypothetical protein